MKKKIFSPLLFMALTLAVSSLFVSCKDYDDDIDSLRLDQTDLLSKLTSLETSVNGQLSSLTASLSSVQTTANDALAKANQAGADITKLQGSVDEVANTAKKAGEAAANAEALANGAQSSADKAQGSADDAAKAAAAAKEAADKAQKAADDAMAKANEAFELAKTASDNSTAVDALTKAQSALTQIASINTQIGQLQTLAGEIPTLKTQINNAATKEELNSLKTTVDAYQEVFDTLFAMATNVELVASYKGSNEKFEEPELTLLYGNVAATADFGDDEAYTGASPVQSFVKGDAITPNQGVYIRVSPSNATLSLKDGIHLINSKGESMDDFIEVTSVEKADMLLTRGAQLNSGLWKVNIAFKADADLDAFYRACNTDYTDLTQAGNPKKVLFAVALNNTTDNKSDRYVASSFDLTMVKEAYKPAAELKFTVNDKDVKDLKNRVAVVGNKTVAQSEDNTTNDKVNEYAWKTTPYADNKDKSTQKYDKDDARSTKDLLKVNLGKPFTVKLDEKVAEVAAYYYVVLDKEYAIESDGSEWEAWSKLYAPATTGLATVTKATESLDLVINDAPQGDIIGFRVFAVNCDGTLLDPDGKAFYVRVNGDIATATVNADLKPEDGINPKWQGVFEIPEAAFKSSTDNLAAMIFDYSDFDVYKQKSKDNAKITCRLLKSKDKNANDNWQYAGNWKDAKYVLITMNDVRLFGDDETFQVVMNDAVTDNGVEKQSNELVINVTKKMPTTDPYGVAFKTAQVKDGKFNAYLTPDNADWKAMTTQGHNVLTSAVNGLLDNNFTWTFANAARDKAKNLVDYKVGYGTTAGSYNIDIDREFVDNTTPHTTTCTYTYKGISLTRTNGEWNAPKDWTVNVTLDTDQTVFACPVAPSVMLYKWDGTAPQAVYGTGIEIPFNKLMAASTYDGSYNDKGKWYDYTLDADNWINGTEVFSKKVVAHLISTKGTDEYFTVTVDATNKKFILVPNSTATNPTSDVVCKFEIRAYDAFGHENVIGNSENANHKELTVTVKQR